MMKVTDEHVHDSKALPELIEKNIIKSNDEIPSIGKLLFADDRACMMVMIFLNVRQQTMEYCCLVSN
jgi:L-arabinose isomerase